MSEFVGRTGSLRVYSYPETRRGGSAEAFARNHATGTKGGVPITVDGVQIPWNAIDVTPDPTPDEDVPITPLSTGVVLITGVATVSNTSGAPILVDVRVQIDDTNQVSHFRTTIPDNSTAAIPFMTESDPIDTPVGVTTNIQVLVTGEGALLVADGSVVEVQEVAVATG
jgi:hypothetical protein